jgi:cytochrome c
MAMSVSPPGTPDQARAFLLADFSWQIKHVWTALGSTHAETPAIRKTQETLSRFHGLSTASGLCHKGGGIVAPFPRTHEEHIMKNLTLSALLVIATSAAASNALAQDVAAGKTSFNKCLACHSIGDGAKNKVGPELNGLDGRKSGTVEGYSYSDANKNSGITWNEAQFKEYIKDPKAKVPGTKMAFAGIKNENEINNLWSFVSQFDKDGKIKAQ